VKISVIRGKKRKILLICEICGKTKYI